jgi:nucleotide-binding universal stress UspA family protein
MSGKARIIDAGPPTTPSMGPSGEVDKQILMFDSSSGHNMSNSSDQNTFCVAIDGSGNSYTALSCVLDVFCTGVHTTTSLEVVHVPEQDVEHVAFDLQPAFVEKEATKEFERWNKQLSMYDSHPESLATSFVNASRFKQGQSVRGTLAYHVNEVSKPKFLVTGIVGAGNAAENIGGISDTPGTTMAHNLWCSRCTSIVVVPSSQQTMVPQHVAAPQKYVVAIDGSGRSHNAFQDVCDLCDASVDSIVAVHVLVNQLGSKGASAAAAVAIEKCYCKFLSGLNMPGRVSYQCVEVDCGPNDQTNALVGEFIATFAKQEKATFLAVGVDGAGVWHDSTLQWKAQQRPAPGRVVRFLSLSQHAPCSLIVNCT